MGSTCCFGSVATWGGRPISRWCRYGYWSEDGSTLYKAYESASPYNYKRIIWP